MSFYEWYQISPEDSQYSVWLNLLYLYNAQNEEYMSFKSYKALPTNICYIGKPELDKKCMHDFTWLQYIGFFCFICIVVSQSFLIYDIVRLRRLLDSLQTHTRKTKSIKGSTVYTVIITSQSFALLLYFFSVIFMGHLGLTGRSFGVCYWVSFGCCVAMVGFAVYYRWSKARFNRFLIMEKLVAQEMSIETRGVGNSEL